MYSHMFVLVASLTLISTVQSASLQLTISADGTSFEVAHDGTPWLSSSDVVVDGFSASAKTLVAMGGPNTHNGNDTLGAFKATAVKWALASAPSAAVMVATYKQYPADESFVVFEQTFPSARDEWKTPKNANFSWDAKNAARTVFPSFDKKMSKQLDAFAFHKLFAGLKDHKLADYTPSEMGGAPLVFYDHTNASLPMMTFSPLNQPMAHQMMATHKTMIGAGVKSSIKHIPAGWKQSFILSAGVGIKDGMMAWGDHILAHTGKKRADMYKDDTHSKIGFWTDNGGFYHYSVGNTSSNSSLGNTYMEVLPKVKAYHDSQSIPFGHWQFDSWFYPKHGGVNSGGGGGGVTNWTNGGKGCKTDQTCFGKKGTPGMQAIQDILKLPMVMHNRQWSRHSDYIKNLSFEWYINDNNPNPPEWAIMKDPEAFFLWFFKQQEKWGLSMYEQDWMGKQYDGVDELHQNITLGDAWLKGMADGAEHANITVQFCMPYPNQVMSAAAYSAVTNARATNDYFIGNNWAIGSTSLFYWAIGILPYKDGFYSSNHLQTGGQQVGPETNPDREALMATLSCAMVGPMDGIGLLNKTRIMTTCMADGTVLKPDAPVHTSDSCFLAAKGKGCWTYHTESAVAGYGTVHYIYDDDGGKPLIPRDAHLSAADIGKYVVRNWYTGALHLLAASTPLAAGYEKHNYATVSPVVNGWVFLGEVKKYVVAAGKRFGKVDVAKHTLIASVNGIKGETVKVCAAMTRDMKTMCKTLTFNSTGVEKMMFQARFEN